MEDNRKEQYEALETLAEFNKKVVKNMGIVVKELSGARLEDTDKLLEGIVNAVNWEIQVLNGTMSVLNEDKNRVDKSKVNDEIVALGSALKTKDDSQIADAIKHLIPVFEELDASVAEVLALAK